MPIDPQQVQRIAELAELDLDRETLERFSDQLQSILDYVAMLEEIDVDAIPPTGSILGQERPPREDTPAGCLSAREALANAPDQDAGHFRVPRVIKG